MLAIKNLSVTVEEKPVITNLSLEIKRGEVHALMGPNGSGKSSLAYTLMGHPAYTVTSGEVLLDGKNLLELKAEDRAKAGLFLAFQQPTAISGVTVMQLLRAAWIAMHGLDKIEEFFSRVKTAKKELNISDDFLKRSLNENFSGGEKKRMEIFQLRVLRPKFAIIDEIDSGLDVDALREISHAVTQDQKMGILIITHYNRILKELIPDHVHVLQGGTITESGDAQIAERIESSGYVSS